MDSTANARNKEVSDFRYNFQHLVFVSKYRFKVFKKLKAQLGYIVKAKAMKPLGDKLKGIIIKPSSSLHYPCDRPALSLAHVSTKLTKPLNIKITIVV